MAVGTVTPGARTTIAADTISSLPASYTITPSPTMPIVAADMAALTLAMATADKCLDTKIATERTARIAADVVTEWGIADLASVAPGGGASEAVTGHASTTRVTFSMPAHVGDILTVDVALDAGTSDPTIAGYVEAVQDYGGSNVAARVPGTRFYFATVARTRLALTGVFTVATAGTLSTTIVIVGGGTLNLYGTGGLRASLSHTGA